MRQCLSGLIASVILAIAWFGMVGFEGSAGADGLPSGILPESSFPGTGQIAQENSNPGLWGCTTSPNDLRAGESVTSSLSNATLTITLGTHARFGSNSTAVLQVANGSDRWSTHQALARPSGGSPLGGICVVKVLGDLEPVGLVDLGEGGNWCATEWRFLVPTSGHRLRVVNVNQCMYQSELFDADGQAAILTDNFQFIARLPGHGDGGIAPVVLLSLTGNRVTDVTRHFPSIVQADAASQWQNYLNEAPVGGYGALAAWMADECNLGDGDTAWTKLTALIQSGALRKEPPEDPGGSWPSGRAYVWLLRAFLQSHGYCQSARLNI